MEVAGEAVEPLGPHPCDLVGLEPRSVAGAAPHSGGDEHSRIGPVDVVGEAVDGPPPRCHDHVAGSQPGLVESGTELAGEHRPGIGLLGLAGRHVHRSETQPAAQPLGQLGIDRRRHHVDPHDAEVPGPGEQSAHGRPAHPQSPGDLLLGFVLLVVQHRRRDQQIAIVPVQVVPGVACGAAPALAVSAGPAHAATITHRLLLNICSGHSCRRCVGWW